MSKDSAVKILPSSPSKTSVSAVDFPCEMYNDALFFKEEAKKLDPTSENYRLRWRYLRASIIFSLTSTEAYVNTFISDHVSNTLGQPDMAQKMSKKRLSLDTKLEYILPLTTGKRMDKTKKEWIDYKAIRKIRDRLVHYDKGEEIYKDKAPYGINMANAEKGIEMVRGIVKQLCALTKKRYPPWVDQTQSWIPVNIENSSYT